MPADAPVIPALALAGLPAADAAPAIAVELPAELPADG
jgi:hypothetical protein